MSKNRKNKYKVKHSYSSPFHKRKIISTVTIKDTNIINAKKKWKIKYGKLKPLRTLIKIWKI